MIHCDHYIYQDIHTWSKKYICMSPGRISANQSEMACVHALHIQLTSSSPKTSSGMSWQCWWNHLWQESHSAMSTPSSSGKRQTQCSSTFWVHLTPLFFLLHAIGKRDSLQSCKHLAKCSLIVLGSNVTLHGSSPLQMSCA